MAAAVAPQKLTPPELAAGERLVRAAVYCRAEASGGKTAPNGEAYDVKIIASTGRVARDGGIILASAWASDLSRFLANPVVLWCHSYDQPPVGICVQVQVDEQTGMLVEYWRFLCGLSDDDYDRLANRLKVLYQAKGLNAASVGFIVHEYRDPTNEETIQGLQQDKVQPRWVATRAELLETSAVPVPADPYAMAVDRGIRDAERKGIPVDPLKACWEKAKHAKVGVAHASVQAHEAGAATARGGVAVPPVGERAAITYGSAHPDKNYSVAAKGAAWDAGKEVKAMPAEKAALRLRHAWVKGDGDPDIKGSYKFPHHRAGSGAAVVFTACAAIFARLGSAKIPAGDKDGVASHAGKHYKADFETDPPERAAVEAAAAAFPAGERGEALWKWAAAHAETLRLLGGGDGQLGLELIRAVREEETVTCPGCGEDVPASADVCPFCGISMPGRADTVKCPSCGKDVTPTDAGMCPSCGEALPRQDDEEGTVACPNCGKDVKPTGDGKCPECGADLEDEGPDAGDLKQTVATVAALMARVVRDLRTLDQRLTALEGRRAADPDPDPDIEARVAGWMAAGEADLGHASPDLEAISTHVAAAVERCAPQIDAVLQRRLGVLPATTH